MLLADVTMSLPTPIATGGAATLAAFAVLVVMAVVLHEGRH